MELRHAEHITKPTSERRLETRFKVHETVKVTLLDDSYASWWGETVDASATGISFSVPVFLRVGSLLKLEVPDGMILGEVRHCQLLNESTREHLVGMSIEHVLFGWMEFYRRARAQEIVTDEPEILVLPERSH